MSNPRLQRVAGQIKKEMSSILREEVKDPRVNNSIITLTDVTVSRDLGHAWIYVSIMEDNAEEKSLILSALEHATGFIRTQIGKRVRLRHVPEIHFVFDKSIEYGAHINEVLKNINSSKDN